PFTMHKQEEEQPQEYTPICNLQMWQDIETILLGDAAAIETELSPPLSPTLPTVPTVTSTPSSSAINSSSNDFQGQSLLSQALTAPQTPRLRSLQFNTYSTKPPAQQPNQLLEDPLLTALVNSSDRAPPGGYQLPSDDPNHFVYTTHYDTAHRSYDSMGVDAYCTEELTGVPFPQEAMDQMPLVSSEDFVDLDALAKSVAEGHYYAEPHQTKSEIDQDSVRHIPDQIFTFNNTIKVGEKLPSICTLAQQALSYQCTRPSTPVFLQDQLDYIPMHTDEDSTTFIAYSN
ncbi:unnamed protein product, partial [Meganyctiphanes norvegica]